MIKENFEKKGWNEKEPGVFIKTALDSVFFVNLETGEGKITIYKSKYGKLEIRFMIKFFSSVEDLEIFCLKFLLLPEQ